jgi:gliding motility-associated-like protein
MNQKLDSTDLLIKTICLHADSLSVNGSYYLENKINAINLRACTYFILNKNSCICAVDTLIYNISQTQVYQFRDSICNREFVNLGFPAFPDKKYMWTGGMVSCDSCAFINQQINVNILNDTILKFTLTESDLNGCNSIYKYDIQVHTADAGSDQVFLCLDPLNSIQINAVGSGHWTSKNDNPSKAKIANPDSNKTEISNLNVSGNYKFIWTTDFGCKDTISVMISLTADAGNDTTVCINLSDGQITLFAKGQGNWRSMLNNPADAIIAKPFDAITTASNLIKIGYYQFIWKNMDGCEDTVGIQINSIPSGILTVLNSCPDEIIQIDAGNKINYSWHGTDIINPTKYEQSFINNKQRIIFLSYKDSLNCQVEDSFLIYPLVDTTEIILIGDSIVTTGKSTKYCIVGGQVIRWEPDIWLDCDDCPCIEITPLGDTTYTVLVKDIYNCEHLLRFRIYLSPIECDTSTVFLPNAFSPNDDRINDILFVRSQYLDADKKIPIIQSIRFGIYDRWGEKVFESFDLNNGWDGSFRGKLLPPDVYGYFLEAVCIGGKVYFKKGNVSILK